MRQRLEAREQFDQRRFAGAIYSDQRDAIAALDHEIYIFKDLLIAVGFRDSLELCNNPAARLRLGERKMDGLFFFRKFNALDFLQFFDPALHLLCLCGLVTKAIDEDLELLNAIFLIFICSF